MVQDAILQCLNSFLYLSEEVASWKGTSRVAHAADILNLMKVKNKFQEFRANLNCNPHLLLSPCHDFLV